jgi:anti-sigma factor (TIGR02949 family)
MAIQCVDVETLVQTHLDGELAEEDASELQSHLAACSSCCEAAAEEARFHAELRHTLAPPVAPAGLRARISAELERDDSTARKDRRARWSWALPAAATLAAAAALFLFVVENQRAEVEAPVAYDAVRQHIRRPPIEVQGAAVTPWVKQHLSPGVEVPRFSDRSTSLRGARLSHLRGRDAVLLYYDASVRGRRHAVTATILDAADLDLRTGERHAIGDRDLWVGQDRGYNIVTFKGPDGFGYVFTSEMDSESLLDFVVNSDLLLRPGEPTSWRRR